MVIRHPLRWHRKFTTRTIARDLVLGLITVVTLVAGGFIGVNYMVLARQNQAQFQQKTHEYLSYLQGSLAAPIWNFDDEAIKSISESLLKNEIVAGLQVFDYKQSPMFSVTDTNPAHPLPAPRLVDVMYRNKQVGHLEVVFSKNVLEERNRQLLVSSLLTLGVILISLISATGLLLKMLVGKPMDQVHHAISRFTQGDYQLRADLPPQREVAQIINQFNSMAEQIQSRENALTETNRRFEAIWDHATAVFSLKDVTGRYLLINKRFEQLRQVDRKTIIGKKDQDVFPKELADGLLKNDERVLAADRPIEFEETASQDDGTHTYLSVKFPLKDSHGKTYAVCSISTDITPRQRAEQEVRKLNQDLELRVQRRTNALNQSNQQLKGEMAERLRAEAAMRSNEALLLATLESTVDGILVIQQDVITHANQRFWQMWGFPENASRNQSIDTLRAHIKGLLKDPEEFTESTNRIYQSPDDALDVLSLRDGRVFERYSCPLIIDQQNRGRVWCFRNISDKKRVEDAMAQAKEAAEAASRAKSDFLASMSHEIRTPMNGVMGMSGLLMETDLNKEQREFANTIQTSAESLLTIINDILDFSKIEAGKLDLETVDFDLTAAVEEVTEMLALSAHQKGLALGSLIHANVPQHLRGDPGRLRQIIVNLASNAIKFTEEGSVTIDVALESETISHAKLRVTVTDTGIGIPTDRQDRLFKSFSQVDTSTTRKFGGTGLGLAISKQLANLLHGDIGVEGAEGRGTVFWFSAQFQKHPNPPVDTSDALPSLAGKRILIVDDIKVNLDILSAYLENWGCDFATTQNGKDAVRMLGKAARSGQGFDLVMIDHLMPDMDGDALAAAIQSDPEINNIIMVRLSSAGVRKDTNNAKALGFQASLAKPIKRHQLHKCISTLLGQDTGRESQPAEDQQSNAFLMEEVRKKNVRVLVVEDNTTNQKVARHILTKFGCRADVAANGAESVQAYQHIPYDLILMDIQMPVMDGLSATRKIREIEAAVSKDGISRPHHTPIVALTANVMKGDRENCLAAGMDDFLAKPINPDEVWQKINQWVINKPADDPSLPSNTVQPNEKAIL